MGKCCLHASSFIFDWIIIKVAGNQDRHKSSDWFDFGPDQNIHFGVTCPCMTKISHFRTWISLEPADQSWSNFMSSITGVGKGCIRFWGRLDKNSGCPWPQKAPKTTVACFVAGTHHFLRFLASIPMVRRPSVVVRRTSSTLSNLNISEASWPILIKFYV